MRIVSVCGDEAKKIFENHKQKNDNNGTSKKYLDLGMTNEKLIISRDFLDGL